MGAGEVPPLARFISLALLHLLTYTYFINLFGVHTVAQSIIEQIMELEAKKQELMAKAKEEALKAAEKAVADLNNLGFAYRLIETINEPRRTVTSADGSTRTRRSGVADEVLELIKKSPSGLSRGAVIEQLGAHDKSAQQSISNALSNLKKKGQLAANGGIYTAI